jgi:hypothetical protein
MKITPLILFCLALASLAQPPTPPLPKAKQQAAKVVKGGTLLASHAQAAVVVSTTNTVTTNTVTLAWNPMPTGSVFDCFTIWGSTDFATWIPVVTVSSNVTMTTFIQTNASEFFVIRAENQSAPSNIVTNPVIKTK